jgi:hypothetical protein
VGELFRGPQLQRLDGISAPKIRDVELASQLLALAVALSAVAAILAVAGWISPKIRQDVPPSPEPNML